jgi:hypothetical protein
LAPFKFRSTLERRVGAMELDGGFPWRRGWVSQE